MAATPQYWLNVADKHYKVNLDANQTLHAFWTQHTAPPGIEYFLAISDGSTGLPYNERPLSFVSYFVDTLNSARNSLGEIRGENIVATILKHGHLVETLPNIPLDEQPFFKELLERLRIESILQTIQS